MLRTAESISDIHKVGSYGHIVWNQCINIGFTYATASATSSIFYQNNKQHSFYLPYHEEHRVIITTILSSEYEYQRILKFPSYLRPIVSEILI